MTSPGELSHLFAQSLSSQQLEREQAQQMLQQLASSQWPTFLLSLSQDLLAQEQQPPAIRTAAGLYLKNQLSARDVTRRQQLHQNWMQLVPEDVRLRIKQACLLTLGSQESKAATAAAQVIAAISCVELPLNAWPELVPTLLQNMATAGSSPLLKQASLQTIGFVCEEVPPAVLESQANPILTAVIQGARKEEGSLSVRLAALQALMNCLEFVKGNFERSNERDFIMQVCAM